jgi:hypothetical protein
VDRQDLEHDSFEDGTPYIPEIKEVVEIKRNSDWCNLRNPYLWKGNVDDLWESGEW